MAGFPLAEKASAESVILAAIIGTSIIDAGPCASILA